MKIEGEAKDFQHIPRDLANVNAVINMFDPNYYINPTKYSPKFAIFFFTVSQSTQG